MSIEASAQLDAPSKVLMAILDEPPFCWLNDDGTAAGCDVEVAEAALRLAGIRFVDFTLVTFPELIPGVVEGRWHLTTGMFITDARREHVRFTRPIWAALDGLIIRSADARQFTSYTALAADPDARLGVVVGQVQGDAARRAGVPLERLVRFTTQEDAVQAVLRAEIDATASTAIGNRALVARLADPRLLAVEAKTATNEFHDPHPSAIGAFCLSHEQIGLADALDAALGTILGSSDHHEMMNRHGFTHADLGALPST